MSGIMRTTVSPSISSSTRSTPWVDGCCGPMFRIMVRSWPGSSTGVGVKWAIVDFLAVPLHGIIFAQGVAFPVLGHQNAPQIWMAGETNAEKIEHFALEIIGAGPYGSERLDRRAVAVQVNFQPDAFFFRDRQQVIDNLKPGFGRIPVDASDVGKEIVRASGIVFENRASLADEGSIDINRHFLAIEFHAGHGRRVPGEQAGHGRMV